MPALLTVLSLINHPEEKNKLQQHTDTQNVSLLRRFLLIVKAHKRNKIEEE